MTVKDRARYLAFMVMGYAFLAVLLVVLGYRIYITLTHDERIIGVIKTLEINDSVGYCRLEIEQADNSRQELMLRGQRIKELKAGDSIDHYYSRKTGDFASPSIVGFSFENTCILAMSLGVLLFMIFSTRNPRFVLQNFDKDPPVG